MSLPLPESAAHLRYAQENPGEVLCIACGDQVAMAAAVAIPVDGGLLFFCEPCEAA